MNDKPHGESLSPASKPKRDDDDGNAPSTDNNSSSRPWQLNKTVLQSNRFMLENKIACDICFEVGLPDGTIEHIYSHKYQLISRSPIFEAKLTAPGAESIRIPDVEPLPFKQLLRYIYYEEVDLRTNTAMAVWYAAQKYMILQLDKLCIEFVKKNLQPDNVCHVLEQAILYDNEEITQLCLALISTEAETVFESPSFIDLSHTALERIIRHEELKISELKVFDVCLQWAKERCTRRGLDPTVGANLRHFLGTIIYQIRFPLIDAKDLSSFVVPSGVLTDRECTAIFQWILSEDTHSHGLGHFRTDKRKELLHCDRFRSVSNSDKLDCKPTINHSIAIRCDRDILLTGIGAYGSKGTPSIHEVTLSVKRLNGELLARSGSIRIQTDGTEQPMRIFLQRPVLLEADEWHSIWLNVLGQSTYKGDEGQKTVIVDKITFNFRDMEDATNMSDVTSGQIPQILFYHT